MYNALFNLSACYVTHDAIKTSNRCNEHASTNTMKYSYLNLQFMRCDSFICVAKNTGNIVLNIWMTVNYENGKYKEAAVMA